MKTFGNYFVPSLGTLLLCYFASKILGCRDKEKDNKDNHSSKDDDHTSSSSSSSSSDYESSMTMPSEWAVYL